MKKHYEIPLLNEHHGHTSFAIAMRNCLDLRSVKDIDKALSLIGELKDDINVVIGWTFGTQKRAELEKMGPLLVIDASMHNYIMNEKAKDKLRDRFPVIVENIENIEWIENNIYEMIKFIPQIKTVTEQDVIEFFDFMLKENQIYLMEDLLLANSDFIDFFEKTGFDSRLKYWIDIKSYFKLPAKYQEKISGFKMFLDGAISPGTAAMVGYVNPESDGGLKLYTDEGLAADLKTAMKENKAVAIHALGEIAIKQLLDVIDKENIKLPLIRIEHAQYIDLEMAKKCKAHGIVLSMQVNFSIETELFKGKLKDECLVRNNPFRMLIDEAGFVPGEDLIFSSDGMPYGAQAALENALFPPVANQVLTIDEFIKGYCIDTMEPGKISFDVEDGKVLNLKTVL